MTSRSLLRPSSWTSNLNLPALLSRALQLRNVPCTCDSSQRPHRGSLNWAIFLTFEDGAEWVFRSPVLGEDDLSLEVAGELLASEVATMKFVRMNSSVPVPEVYDYSPTASNPIMVPYILMSKAPGIPLQDLRWSLHSLDKGIIGPQRARLSDAQKEKVTRQPGGIAAQLLDLRFGEIGSLVLDEEGRYRVGKCFSPAFIFHDRETLGDSSIQRGPFACDENYYQALISVFLLHVQELRIQHNVFFAPIPSLSSFETSQQRRSAICRWEDFVKIGRKIDSGKNRLDYCTAAHFLQQILPSLGPGIEALEELSKAATGGGFPLHHSDLSSSNIFVDDDLNITCIIDWGFSSTVPVSTALMTPSLPNPRDDTEPGLDLAFRAGFIAHRVHHHYDARLLRFKTRLWECARRAWLFTRLVVLDGERDYVYLKELYLSAHNTEPTEEGDEVSISDLFRTTQKEDKFIELAEELADDEEWAPGILKEEEEDYFAVVGGTDKSPGCRITQEEIRLRGIERRAIARKINVVSELSQDFVADERLWRWIEEMKRDLAAVTDDD